MKLQAVILDFAGTVVDFGCIAPMQAFRQALLKHGLDVSLAIVRLSMGKAKRQHLEDMLAHPEVAAQWLTLHGAAPTPEQVDQLYADSEAAIYEVLEPYSALIPGAAEAVAQMRAQGLKIGGNTGYTAQMMAVLMPLVEAQGYQPDAIRNASDVKQGRPAPWMLFQLLEELNVYPVQTVVKIGDTVADIHEGLNAGCWTIGLTRCGNLVGLTEAELMALPAERQQELVRTAEQTLKAAGAHYTAPDLQAALPLLEEINQRLARGERP